MRTLRLPLVLLACLALSASACRKLDRGGGSSNSAAAEALTETYVSPTKLITLHYPSDFAAKTVGKSSLMLVKNLPGTGGDAVLATFITVETPVSNDLKEFSRVVLDATHKELNGWAESYRKPGTCFGQPGTVSEGKWMAKGTGLPSKRWSCAFLRKGHGYSFSYDVPPGEAAKYEPLMHRIIDATEFLDTH
jgi:hypothetical protein